MPPANKLLQADQCLLVVIDAQEKLMPVIWEHEKVTGNLVRLAKFAQIIGLPAVITEQQKLGPTLPAISQELPNSPVISKITFDSFACPEFRQTVASLGRQVLLLAGVESHICVLQTALSGLRDYKIQVIRDAVSSRSPHNLDAAMDRLQASGVTITTTEMAVYELLGRAGTDNFRAALPLIK